MQPIVVNNIKSFELPLPNGLPPRRVYFPAGVYNKRLYILSAECNFYEQFVIHQSYRKTPPNYWHFYLTLVDTDGNVVLSDFPVQILGDTQDPTDYIVIDRYIDWEKSYVTISKQVESVVPGVSYSILFHFFDAEPSNRITPPTRITSLPIGNLYTSGYTGKLADIDGYALSRQKIKRISFVTKTHIIGSAPVWLSLYSRQGNEYERIILNSSSLVHRHSSWCTDFRQLNQIYFPDIEIDPDRTIISIKAGAMGLSAERPTIDFYH